MILWEAGQLMLQRDDGGRWRLDALIRAESLVGRRMRVRGIRSGFDLLDVTAITEPGRKADPALALWRGCTADQPRQRLRVRGLAVAASLSQHLPQGGGQPDAALGDPGSRSARGCRTVRGALSSLRVSVQAGSPTTLAVT